MKVSELKEIIDGVSMDVPQGDCYLAMAKVGNEVSVSFEGQGDMLATSLFRLMKKYKNLADVVMAAADAYEAEDF